MRIRRIAVGEIGMARCITVLAVVLLSAAACTPPAPSKPQAPKVSTFAALGAPFVDPALVPLQWAVSDPQGDALTCRLDGDGDGVWDETFDPCPATASRNVPDVVAGTHTARLEVSDGTHTTTATTTYVVGPATTTEPFNIEIRPSGPMDADVLAAFEAAASRWEQVIVRGVSDMHVTLGAGSCGTNSPAFDGVVDDLVVNVSMQVIPPAAWSAPCVYGPDSLPRFSFVEVNPDTLPNLRTLDDLDEVALHELGHALGFGIVWQFNRNLVAGATTTDPRFTGPRAIAETSALGWSGNIPIMTIDGVMQPHWESAFFGPEIMATVPDGSALSRITIASMADLGYAVNLDAADPYTPPLPPGTCITFSATVVRCW